MLSLVISPDDHGIVPCPGPSPGSIGVTRGASTSTGGNVVGCSLRGGCAAAGAPRSKQTPSTKPAVKNSQCRILLFLLCPARTARGALQAASSAVAEFFTRRESPLLPG